MRFTQTDKVHQLILRIRRVGVMHGGAAVAETPFWPEQRFTGQANKCFGDIQRPSAGEQVVIDIARFRLPAAIGGVVVINFIAQIQPATAQIIVEQAIADVATLGEGKGDMLVQRVGTDGVIAHCVEITHFIAFTVALKIAGLLAKTIKSFVLAAAQIVRRAVAVGVEQIGAGGAVIDQREPFAVVMTIAPLQPQRLVDGDTQLPGGDRQAISVLFKRPRGQAKAAQILTRAAFPRHVLLRCNAPGTVQRQLTFALKQDAEQVLFQYIQAQRVLPVDS